MKAAVIYQFGDTPRYEDFPDPVVGKDETLVYVKACTLENFDKGVAGGAHYSSKQLFPKFPAIVGVGGIGITEDGRLVGFGGMKPPYGAYAEKVAVGHVVPIPEGIDIAIAAALPRPALTSFLPLNYTAKLQKGETVLINGATGVAGKLAIQVAKLLGAGRVVGTGRNETTLRSLSGLGADAVIDLKQSDEALSEAFANEAGDNGYNIVIDFLWGSPAALLLQSFVPKKTGFPEKRVRYIHIGQKAGAAISLTGEMLRTSGVEIYGVGKISQEAVNEGMTRVWEWIKEDKLHIDIEKTPLADIAKAWHRDDLAGKRLVIIP